MPVKLIGTILLVVFVAVLTGFNLDNKSDIWFFHTFKDIPIIYTVLSSFVLGVIVTLPSIFIHRKRRDDRSDKTSVPSVKKDKGGDE